MAMRPRGGDRSTAPRGGPRQQVGGVWPVYEDFKPESEWQQDDDSRTLNIFLPGFMKEQIRVSTEDNNIIRVRGERLVAGNKWSRFQEDFQVPDNGKLNSVRVKYQGGTLAITVPKNKAEKRKKITTSKAEKRKKLTTSKPKSNDIEKQPKPQKGKDKISEAGTGRTREEKSKEPQKKLSDPRMKQGADEDQKLPLTPKDQSKPIEGVVRTQSPEMNSLETIKGSNEPRADHPLSEGKRERRSMTSLKDVGLETERIESNELKERHNVSEKPDEAKNMMDNKSKILESSRNFADAEAAKKMKTHDEATGDKGSNAKQIIRSSGADIGASTIKKLKKMRGLAELNEERQLLVNMGVAVLVIMALGAYVTYNFVTRKETN